MRTDCRPCQALYPRQIPVVGSIQYRLETVCPTLNSSKHTTLSPEPVCDEPSTDCGRSVDLWAMSREQPSGSTREYPTERTEICAHITFRRTDNNTPLGNHKIARDESSCGSKCGVFGRMARRVKHRYVVSS
ncbi:MAG: hypothetical protein J07HR59_00184, partial [Halorubrum sp. J07HR59]